MNTKVMGPISRGLATALTVAGFLVAAIPAYAISVSYTVGGVIPTSYPSSITPPANAPWGVNGYPGDTVEIRSYTDELNLTPGTYTQKVNTLLWTINYTYGGTATNPAAWSNMNFEIDAGRSITIDGVSGSLSQMGSLTATWENDFLSFSAGPTLELLVDGYSVAITLLGLGEVGGSNFSGSNPWIQPSRDMMAQFVVSETPLPAALPLFVTGLGAMGLLGWRRKRKAHSVAA